MVFLYRLQSNIKDQGVVVKS